MVRLEGAVIPASEFDDELIKKYSMSTSDYIQEAVKAKISFIENKAKILMEKFSIPPQAISLVRDEYPHRGASTLFTYIVNSNYCFFEVDDIIIIRTSDLRKAARECGVRRVRKRVRK